MDQILFHLMKLVGFFVTGFVTARTVVVSVNRFPGGGGGVLMGHTGGGKGPI